MNSGDCLSKDNFTNYPLVQSTDVPIYKVQNMPFSFTKTVPNFTSKYNTIKLLQTFTPGSTLCCSQKDQLKLHAAHKMIMESTTGVNFINVLHAHFSYEILALKITKL